MGDLVRFPQERCRWPELGDHRREPAVLMILPAVRYSQLPPLDPIASAETDAKVRNFLDALRGLE